MTITPTAEQDDILDSDLPRTPAEALGILGIYAADDYPTDFYSMYPLLEIIDGDAATNYLARNVAPVVGSEGTNRKWQRGRVLEHADNIRAGRWKLTHQGIAFDPSGNLIDGQHRLMAIQMIAAEKPNFDGVYMWVWRNVPVEVSSVIDTGRARSTTDALTMRGIPDPKQADNTLKLLWRYANADFDSPMDPNHWDSKITSDVLIALIDGYPELGAAVKLGKLYAPIGRANKSNSSILITSAVAAGRIIIDRAYPELIAQTDLFFDKLLTGSNLEVGDPILALRNWGANQYKGTFRSRRLNWLHLAALLKMYRASREGKTIKGGQLSLRMAENFPRP